LSGKTKLAGIKGKVCPQGIKKNNSKGVNRPGDSRKIVGERLPLGGGEISEKRRRRKKGEYVSKRSVKEKGTTAPA